MIKLADNVSLILAFSAGLLSFLSPCVLPIIPGYIGYISGSVSGDIKHHFKFYILYKSIGFVIGFSLIFISLGASITALGKIILVHQALLRKIGGVIIALFGIHVTGVFKIKLLYYEKRFAFLDKLGSLSSVFMGISFGAGWTPCIGPILSSILIYASSTGTIGRGIFLLTLYSLGLGVPFIITALTVDELFKYIRKFSKYTPIISLLSGSLMIFMGILVFTNKVNVLNRYFIFPNF